jgi:predicted O-linked N-acetylglucosamine transferase (SPINDLY family)
LLEAEIDIAVDLSGYISGARPGVFALRPASVAVNYYGYPGTLGTGAIDYIVADAHIVPEGSEHFYAERVVRLPDCYYPTDTRRGESVRPSRAEAGLPESGFVFCTFNNAYKFTPQMFDIWMRLLDQVEGSLLWIYAENPVARANLRAEAEARGVPRQRLVFAERVDHDAQLARIGLADLFLDTLPCNAHTTASDALWAGLPLVTCCGQGFAARVAGSLLHAIGLPELVASDLVAYEALALDLARSPQRLAAIRDRLRRNRDSFPLFDTARLCRALESAYRTMRDIHLHGEKPRGFDVPKST